LTQIDQTPAHGALGRSGRPLSLIAAKAARCASLSPFESQISRINTLKRKMYGRAGYELL
jgi:hypothetical protein